MSIPLALLVVGLVLAMVLWDLGRRRFDLQLDRDQFEKRLELIEQRIKSELERVDVRMTNLNAKIDGRGQVTRMPKFGK